MQRFIIAILFLACVFPACREADKEAVAARNEDTMPFSSGQWTIKKGSNYVYREKMLPDLMTRIKLHGMSQESLIGLLGDPDRKNGEYLYYTIDRDVFGILTLHTKTLVIKLNANKEVEWRKIHQ